MNKERSKWILGTASALALAVSSLAQTDGGLTSNADTNQTVGASESRKSRQFCRSKDLVGAMVRDADGRRLGAISEIYLNAQSGEVIAAISLSARQYALVPLQALKVTAPEGTFRTADVTVNKGRADLESGPLVTDNELRKLDDPRFVQAIYSYYGLQLPAAIGGASSPGGASRGSSANPEQGADGPPTERPRR